MSLDDVGAGFDQIFVAAFEARAAEIRGGEIAVLEHGAHGPVEDEDAGGKGVGERSLALLKGRRHL